MFWNGGISHLILRTHDLERVSPETIPENDPGEEVCMFGRSCTDAWSALESSIQVL